MPSEGRLRISISADLGHLIEHLKQARYRAINLVIANRIRLVESYAWFRHSLMFLFGMAMLVVASFRLTNMELHDGALFLWLLAASCFIGSVICLVKSIRLDRTSAGQYADMLIVREDQADAYDAHLYKLWSDGSDCHCTDHLNARARAEARAWKYPWFKSILHGPMVFGVQDMEAKLMRELL